MPRVQICIATLNRSTLCHGTDLSNLFTVTVFCLLNQTELIFNEDINVPELAQLFQPMSLNNRCCFSSFPPAMEHHRATEKTGVLVYPTASRV